MHGEVTLLVGEQPGGQGLEDVVQRHAATAFRRGLEAEEAPRGGDEGVAAVEVGLEEALQHLALGARNAAFLITVPVGIPEGPFVVGRGEAGFAHHDGG